LLFCRTERGTQPVFRYSPEVMLHTVHESDRDRFPVLPHILCRLRDITFHPRDIEVLGYPPDHLTSVVAEVAAGTAEQRDSRRGGAHVSHRNAGPDRGTAPNPPRHPMGDVPAASLATQPLGPAPVPGLAWMPADRSTLRRPRRTAGTGQRR